MNLVFLLLISALGLAAGDPEGDDLRLYSDSPRELDDKHPVVVSVLQDLSAITTGSPVQRIRAYFDCPVCSEALNSKSLSALSCDHELHESCYLSASRRSRECPVCRNIGPHNNRGRETNLRTVLEAFEEREWISMPKLYPDSPLPVDFSDPLLRSLMVDPWPPRMQSALLSPVFHDLVSILNCPVCFRHLNSRTISILACGHGLHEGCYRASRPACPICKSLGPHESRNSDAFLRELLKVFESKQWILLPKLYADSPRLMDFSDPVLVSFASMADNLLSDQGPHDVDIALDLQDGVVAAQLNSDYDLLRKLLACPHCRRRYSSKSLAILACGHGMHERCFMGQVALAITACPTCGVTGPHRRRHRHSLLRDILQVFEAKQWMLEPFPGDRLYQDSNVNVNFLDPDLALLVYRHPKLMKIPREIVGAVADANSLMLADAFECPACYQRMPSNNFRVLGCGHALHETCFQERGLHSRCPLNCPRQVAHETDSLEVDFGRLSLVDQVRGANNEIAENHAFLKNALLLFEGKGWMPRPVSVLSGLHNPLEPVVQLIELLAEDEWPFEYAGRLTPLGYIESLFVDNRWFAATTRQQEFPGFYDVGGEVPVCGVCSEFISANRALELACSHSFHRDCINHLGAAVQATCPICHGFYSSFVSRLLSEP